MQGIARYAGVEPENVVLGAGADDLILLCARTFAGPGDVVAIAAEPTYPLYRIGSQLAGAEVGAADPVVTFCCRPNNPTGELGELPAARPLVVDEAYFEYAGVTAAGLVDDGVVVLRTFSKSFGLAGARVGYALADRETAAELNRRQAPQPISNVSAALALAGLADPPDVGWQIEERERCARALHALGLDPLSSATNFLFVPVEEPEALAASLLRSGIVVRVYADGLRFNVRDREDDDLLLDALARALARPAPVAEAPRRRGRHLRATAETRIRVRLGLDGAGRVRVATGAGLYDHLLEQLAFHAGFDLVLEGVGDLETGEHHTAEDAALALGEALDAFLGDRRGIARYGDAVVPMDDALARAAVDLGGRPASEVRLERRPGPRRAHAAEPRAGRAARDQRRLERPRRASRRRGRVQGCWEGASCGRPRREHRRPVDEGSRVNVAVCAYGAGNVRSVVAAFGRLGADARVTSSPAEVAAADLAVLPGVGSAASAMTGLRERGLDDALRDRVAAGGPTLGICLGLQLALEESEEDGGVAGLGILPGRAVRHRRGPRPTDRLGAGRAGRRGVLLRTLVRRRDARCHGLLGRHRGDRRDRELPRRPVPPREERSSRCPHARAMPLPRLIPCLDVAGGRVVKGVRFQGLAEVGDPVELGALYSEAGADELVYLDVKATVDERAALLGLVARIADRLAIPFTVGGGVRSVADAESLLEAGADKVSVNSAALDRPELVSELAARLGSQAVVVAIDATGGEVRSHAGSQPTGRAAAEWAREVEGRGAGEILLTSIDADGTRDGYDLELTRSVSEAVSLPVIASGGAGSARHIADVLDVAQAALLASILHESPARLVTLREELRELGVSLRDAA